MDFTETELNEGIRFVWNCVPSSRQLLKQNMIPFGVFVNPFFERETPLNQRLGAPLKCGKCDFMASPYCSLDYYNTRTWICSNCGNSNGLSNQIVSYLSQGGELQEFDASSLVFEYVIDSQKKYQKTLILLLDTSMTPEELDKMKQSIIKYLPSEEYSYNLAIITFGKHVKLHNLTSKMRQELVLDGQKTYSEEQILSMLSLREALANSAPNSLNKFIQPIETCKARVLKIIERLKPDSFEIVTKKEKKRKLRCTGNAIFVASLIASCFSCQGTKIASFLGGACTFGPGRIISEKLEDHFRSHVDLEKNATKLSEFNKAKKFYSGMIDRFVKFNLTLDLFSFCLDQYGLGEMSALVQQSGGLVINHEEFKDKEYDVSVERYMGNIFGQGTIWAGKNKVFCSEDMALHGALGNLKVVNKIKELETLDNLIGQTGGNQFYLGNCGSSGSLLFLFQQKKPEITISEKPCFFQFQSSYCNSEGNMILRVATFSRNFSGNLSVLGQSIDQEAAIAAIARISSFKTTLLDTTDVIYWLNTVLIKFLRRISKFTKNKPETLQITENVSLLPQFIFYFRKSEFIQKFGTSVDEFSLFGMSLFRESLNNMLVMIQPSLFAYTLDNPEALPVLCDMESLSDDRILVVDTYFFVLIWHGKNIHYWKEQDFQNNPDFQHFKDLLEMTNEDAMLLMEDRLPVPRLMECHPGSPFERVLKSKLNPKAAKTEDDTDENYSTDDVNLKTFMDYLVKLVVKSD